MGLINDSGSRTMLYHASRMWGESTLFLLALGLTAGCISRPEPTSADTTTANPVVKTAVDGAATAGPAAVIAVPGGSAPGEITSTGSAEGHTYLHFTLLPEVQEGDLIHILANERVVATALITGIDATSATALVTGLTDRTRSVAVGDVAVRLAPEEVLPANVAPTTPATVAPLAVAEIEPLPSEHSPSKAASVSVVAATEATITSAPPTASIAASIPALTSAQIPAPIPESLAPEVRARLTAERAYFELATRVLRLPDAGPELTELQARLRSELAALELLP